MVYSVVNEGLQFEIDIGSAQNVNSPNYLTAAYQSQVGIGVPTKKNKIAVFDGHDVTENFVEMGDQRYPKDSISINSNENEFLDQYRDPKLFYGEYVGVQFLSSHLTDLDMMKTYRNQVVDLRRQVHQITPEKIQLLKKFSADHANARKLVIKIRHREYKLVSDGSGITEIEVI